MIRSTAVYLSMALLVAPACLADEAPAVPFSKIEISRDAEENGQTVYSVKFSPRARVACDRVEFECVYHQEFPWENFRGEAYTKIHEPVNFVYRRENIRFLTQLDWYCNFRVPTARKLLETAYGEKAFNRNHPITIARMIIRGVADEKVLWSYELPPSGSFDAEALAKHSTDVEDVEEE